MENTVIILEELKELNPEKHFRDNLEVEEFEGLETLVRDSVGVISWEELIEEGVVKIENRKVKGIYRKGNLNLRGTVIKSLWKLKEIGGSLDCCWVKSLEDLGELEEVKENVLLEETSIKTLGKLKKVGKYLGCNGLGSLKDLGELQDVGTLWLLGTSIESLGKLENVSGNLRLDETSIKSLGRLKRVGKELNCYGVKNLEDLGDLEEVGGNFILSGTLIKTLGKLKKVGGFLTYRLECDLEDFGELEEVEGDLYIKDAKVKTFGRLKKVGGNLNCENIGTLEDLETLEYVGGELNITGVGFNIYIAIIRKIKHGELIVKEGIKPIDLIELYNNKEIDFLLFQEKFGEDINKIEDVEIKKILKAILILEYEFLKEKSKEGIYKLKKENEGKELKEKEKKEIREKVLEIEKKFMVQKEILESFGVKLDDL